MSYVVVGEEEVVAALDGVSQEVLLVHVLEAFLAGVDPSKRAMIKYIKYMIKYMIKRWSSIGYCDDGIRDFNEMKHDKC